MSRKPQGRGDQFARETRIGLTVIGCLFLVFLVVAYRRISGSADSPPAEIRTVRMADARTTPQVTPRLQRPSIQRNGRSPSHRAPVSINAQSEGIHDSPAAMDRANPRNQLNPPTTIGYQSNPNSLPAETSLTPDRLKTQTPSLPPPQIRSVEDSQRNPRLGNSPSTIPLPQPHVPSTAAGGQPPAGALRSGGSFAGNRPPISKNTGAIPQQGQAHNRVAPIGQTPTSGLSPRSPQPPNKLTLMIEETDSFWTLSERAYGTGQYFRALHAELRQRYPGARDLLPGRQIQVPSIQALRKNYPQLCPAVQPGGAARPATDSAPAAGPGWVDVPAGKSLFDVARQHLGQASRYVELIQLNQDRLPQGIRGTEPLKQQIRLRLPAN